MWKIIQESGRGVIFQQKTANRVKKYIAFHDGLIHVSGKILLKADKPEKKN